MAKLSLTRRLMKGGSAVSNENDDTLYGNVPGVTPAAEMPEDGPERVEYESETDAALEEVVALGDEIDRDMQEGDMLADNITAGEENMEVLRNSVENGGISVESAQLLALDMKRRGVNGMIATSVESFGAGRSIAQTNISLEGIGQTMKTWWERLKQWFRKTCDKIRMWWKKSWSVAPRIKARAESVKRQAEALTQNAKEKTFDYSGAARYLFVAGAFPANPSEALKKVNTTAEVVYTKISSAGLGAADALTNAMSNASFDDAEKVKTSMTAINGTVPKLKAYVDAGTAVCTTERDDNTDNAGFKPADDSGCKAMHSDAMPGDMVLWRVAPTAAYTTVSVEEDAGTPPPAGGEGGTPPAGGEGGGSAIKDAGEMLATLADQIRNTRYGVARLGTKEIDGDAKQVPTAQRSSIISICDEVMKTCDMVLAYSKEFANQEKAIKQLNKAGDSLTANMSDNTGKVDGQNTSKASSALKGILTSVVKMINEPGSGYGKYFFTTSKAYLSYCERSLAKY